MSGRNSSDAAALSKPKKPHPGFPLFPHATGRWAKKIRGKLHYFGPWVDPDAALQAYLAKKDALHAGLTPADTREGLTVYTLCAKFLTTKKHALENGELSPRTFSGYAGTCKRLIKAFGKQRLVTDLRPDDFENLRNRIARNWGPVGLGNEINQVRIVFNYAVKNGLLDRPIIYGEGFRRPSKKTLRKHRAEQGPKMFEADEIRRVIDSASQPLKAMILLGVNAGYGNADVGTLPLAALDLNGGWVSYHRPKTGIDRRCPLWPETVAALREWLAARPAPKSQDHAELVFITQRGGSWAKEIADNPLTKEMRKLLDKLGINGHRNFYCLRHTFQTIGDEARDFVAVRSIMGHADNDISAVYRERVSDERLRAVTEHVRTWLFGATAARPEGEAAPELRVYREAE
jgi:integrase